MKKWKKMGIVPALLGAVCLCGCSLPMKLTPPELPEDLNSEIVTSEVVSEVLPESGWEKPSDTSGKTSEEKSEKESEKEKDSEKDSQKENKKIAYQFDFDEHNPNEWQKAYRDFLKTLTPASGADPDVMEIESYFLADIEDRYSEYIPELCVKTGTCEADYQLLIYDYNPNTGEVEELVGKDQIFAGHCTFYVAPNGNLVSYGGHMGYLWVEEYSGFANGKVNSKTIYEEDINGKPDVDYKPISEILGDETEAPMSAPVTDDSVLLWYLNVPVPTASGDEDDADVAITAALYDNAEVYVVGSDRYYDGETGLMPFHNLKKAGVMDRYSDIEYELNVYCYTDVNFDGQDEMLIRLASKKQTNPGEYHFAYVLLSYQDGVVYAYAFPYLTYSQDFLCVCEYSVYHNWYGDEVFYGFVFDKDRCNLMYSNCKPEDDPKNAEANAWKTFRVDFGY